MIANRESEGCLSATPALRHSNNPPGQDKATSPRLSRRLSRTNHRFPFYNPNSTKLAVTQASLQQRFGL